MTVSYENLLKTCTTYTCRSHHDRTVRTRASKRNEELLQYKKRIPAILSLRKGIPSTDCGEWTSERSGGGWQQVEKGVTGRDFTMSGIKGGEASSPFLPRIEPGPYRRTESNSSFMVWCFEFGITLLYTEPTRCLGISWLGRRNQDQDHIHRKQRDFLWWDAAALAAAELSNHNTEPERR